MKDPIERRLCGKVVAVIHEALPDAVVSGNWLPEWNGVAKGGLKVSAPSRIEVNVGTRAYDGYTSRVCMLKVSLYGSFGAVHDRDLDQSADAYAQLAGLLDEWQGDIAAVKAALALEDFDPVGFRLDGGDWQIDPDSGERRYSQGFTVKGRRKG